MSCGRFSGWETDLRASNPAALAALLLAQSSVQGRIYQPVSPGSSAGDELQTRHDFVLSHNVQPAARAAFFENRADVELGRAFADPEM